MKESAERLLNVLDDPKEFLFQQKDLLYSDEAKDSFGLNKENTHKSDERGLPPSASFYYSEKQADVKVNIPADRKPRVLNIGSGSEPERQLPHAINLDLSITGRPDIIADASRLPFKSNCMILTMGSHVLEHFAPEEINEVLKEWQRVTHPSGTLRIAVPDAKITLREIVNGVTARGEEAVDFQKGSAPLTQIYGLGIKEALTDPRWQHHILFSEALLVHFLKQAGFSEVRHYSAEDALSTLSGIKTDETNHYSLRLEAQYELSPHRQEDLLTDEEYKELKKDFIPEAHLSIIVPVCNEEKNLPHFFWSLLAGIKNAPLSDLEVIFSLNGCTDQSEELIEYLKAKVDFPVEVIETEKGILPAFIDGIKVRKLNGFICKADVDAFSHSHALGLMYMFLSQQRNIEATYATPIPSEKAINLYNIGEWHQSFRSQRRYIHGRFSMYKRNPFELFNPNMLRESGAVVEDMILSSCYVYYHGLDSIAPTPHAVVKSASASSLEEVVFKRVRIRRENKRILNQFPQFKVLKNILARIAMLPNDEVEKETANLQRYHYHMAHALSALARVVDPEGFGLHTWLFDLKDESINIGLNSKKS